MTAAVAPLDFAGISAGAQPAAPPPAVIPGCFCLDFTGVPVCAPAPSGRRASNQFSVDVRDAYQVILRRMQQERELLKTRKLVRLQEMVTLTNLQRAAVAYEEKLKAARASYAVLLLT